MKDIMLARKFFIFLLFSVCALFLEWLAAAKTAGLMAQRQALFFSREKGDTFKKLSLSQKFDKDNGQTALYRAGIFMKNNDYVKAREESLGGLRTFVSVDSYNQIASIEANLDNIKEAKEWFERVTRLYPEEEGSRLRLAAIAIMQKNFEESSRHLTALENARSENPNVFYYRGMTLLEEGRAQEALEIFHALERLHSADSSKLFYKRDNLYHQMALAEAAMQRWAQAEAHLKKALALKKSDSYRKLFELINEMKSKSEEK